MVEVAQRTHLLEDYPQFLIVVRHLAHIDDAHVHIVRLAGPVNTHDPETKQVGSGVYA